MKPEKWAQKKARQRQEMTGEPWNVCLGWARAQIARTNRDRIVSASTMLLAAGVGAVAWWLKVPVIA